MKKLITCVLLFVAMTISAQEIYWTSYSFMVVPENEDTVFKLIDDYFKEHKTEGVTVALYANHFHDAGNNASHMIVFSGSLDALGGMYATDGGDAWDLLGARLDHHITQGGAARMGTVQASYGDTEGDYTIDQYYIVKVEDAKAFQDAFTKFNTDHKPTGRSVRIGNFTAGISPKGESHWALVSHKDFKGAFGGPNATLNEKQRAERDAGWKEFGENNGGVELIRSGLRVRLGKW